MENFIVSARKYRPATFDTVVGQLSITSTLKNAIKNKHLAQAFLFCGPRGVGKTTCARILAKTINCENVSETIEACNRCPSCLSFNDSHSLNVFELDAASNNSVDDIRNLVEQVRFAPQLGTKKVYIIDEVHMLSTSAFNAFLKTLEEPPSHAIFILATTEKHKIIPTILSRCQIFDFNRIQIDDIMQHLQHIAEKENISAEVDALHIIAQKADGALRDALSIFDQIVTFTGNSVTYKAVIENLNILDYDYYFKVTDAFLNSDIPLSLLTFNDILNNGFDGHNFIVGLASHFRNLLVCKDASTLQLLEVGNNIKDKYKQQSNACTPQWLLDALNISNKFDIQYKSSKNQRLLVELCLMQLCSLKKNVTQINNLGNEKNDTANLLAEKKNDIIIPPAPKTEEKKELVEYKIPNTEKTEVVNEKPPQTSYNPKPTSPKPQTISISQIIKKNISSTNGTEINAEKKENNISEKHLETPLNIDNLLIVWKKYSDLMNEKGKANFRSLLIAHAPQLKENFTVQITIENDVQREELKLEQTELLGFLKKELQNNSITITVVINANQQEKNFFSSQDKFKRMVEINPNLNLLKQRLDLDLEY